ncbi:MAG: hypothetical protein CM15mP93_03970 [Thiotrichaceae bacterium]|nr:MAG: hypothetical protein CM15mP93_03970 [Thiotrichaceae bacterium]
MDNDDYMIDMIMIWIMMDYMIDMIMIWIMMGIY